MAKPQPIEIKSDDCAVTIDGETYYPHEGEAVWLFPGISAGTINAFNAFSTIGVQMEAAQGESGAGVRIAALADEALQKLCTALAPRVVRWTWTDMAGRPLPQPDGTPDRLQALETEELFWLITAVKGETASARKNGSRPSPTISLATAPQPSRTSSGGGHSRRKG